MVLVICVGLCYNILLFFCRLFIVTAINFIAFYLAQGFPFRHAKRFT